MHHTNSKSARGLTCYFGHVRFPSASILSGHLKGVWRFPQHVSALQGFWHWPLIFQSDSCPRLICFILGTDEPGCKCTGRIKDIILTAGFLLAPLLLQSVPCNSPTRITESWTGPGSSLTSSAKLNVLRWLYFWKGSLLITGTLKDRPAIQARRKVNLATNSIWKLWFGLFGI